MGRHQRRTQQPASPPPSVLQSDPAVPPVSGHAVVKLTIDGVDARGGRCPAGTIIGPNVEGWPAHRVNAMLRDGRAKAAPADGV